MMDMIDVATKEEWAGRCYNAEERLAEAQARIAEIETTVKGYLGAMTDSAGGAPNMHRPAQIALLKLQAVIDWPTKGNGDAIRASLGDKA
jgi:hypothetical protein